jgi:transposase-like protein
MKETEGTQLPVCPYCGNEHENYFEFQDGLHTCGACGKEFDVESETTVTFTTRKIVAGKVVR